MGGWIYSTLPSARTPKIQGREMEARGSVVSKARLIRRVTTSCVIDELLEEFARLFSEVTTRLVGERHEVKLVLSTQIQNSPPFSAWYG